MNSTRVNATSKGIINLWKPVCTREYSLPIITIWWQCSWYSLSLHARILGVGFAFGFVFLLQIGSLSLSLSLCVSEGWIFLWVGVVGVLLFLQPVSSLYSMLHVLEFIQWRNLWCRWRSLKILGRKFVQTKNFTPARGILWVVNKNKVRLTDIIRYLLAIIFFGSFW